MKAIWGLILTVFIMGFLLVTLDQAHHNTIMVPGILIVSFFCWHIGVVNGPRWRDQAFWRAMSILNALLVLGLFLQ
jgi:uncharacterized membrane protein